MRITNSDKAELLSFIRKHNIEEELFQFTGQDESYTIRFISNYFVFNVKKLTYQEYECQIKFVDDKTLQVVLLNWKDVKSYFEHWILGISTELKSQPGSNYIKNRKKEFPFNTTMKYKFLVASALQEELNEFLKLLPSDGQQIGDGVQKFFYETGNKSIEILTFSANNMGMPINAAKLMEIILKFNPMFIFFIGTCAGLKNQALGSVLVPDRIFSYESGKYEDGIFKPDYALFETSNTLRRLAEQLKSEIEATIDYQIITDEDFCSGSAVINDVNKIEEINLKKARKVSGLDMEAYSVACINHILKPNNELLVIKGISDLAKDKQISERVGQKELAKKNAAKFALELIRYIDRKNIIRDEDTEKLDIKAATSAGVDIPLKLHLHIRNSTIFPITIKLNSFIITNPRIKVRPKSERQKPMIQVGFKKSSVIPITTDTYTLKANDAIFDCWLPIDELEINEAELKDAILNTNIGYLEYELCVFKNPTMIYSLKDKF